MYWKKFQLLLFILFYSLSNYFYGSSYSRNWLQGKSDREAIDNLLNILKTTDTGRKIIETSKKRAKSFGVTLESVIYVGDVSITDTKIMRKFNSVSPERVEYKAIVKVFINKNLTLKDAVLDLAHELTHYAIKESFNPYEMKLSAKEYIVEILEGKGGEVDAYLNECRVISELFPSFVGHSKCRMVMNHDGSLSKFKGAQQFYKIGIYFKDYVELLKKKGIESKEMPFLNDEVAVFISAAQGLPYPVASYREYLEMMERVCQNDFKRISYFGLEKIRDNNFLMCRKIKFKRDCDKFVRIGNDVGIISLTLKIEIGDNI